MPGTIHEIQGVRIFELDAAGPHPRNDRDAVEIISEVWNHKARWIAIPAARLGDDFFDLKTRIAGEFLQKFVGYKVRVVIVGDISRYVEASNSLRDFVVEANRGEHIWFVHHLRDLEPRLAAEARA